MWHLFARKEVFECVNSLCFLAMEGQEFTGLILSVILSVVLVLFEKWLG
jgi:hypothetical protein